ncbi:unnamed protein product, partial [Prorocentrum cordatum]
PPPPPPPLPPSSNIKRACEGRGAISGRPRPRLACTPLLRAAGASRTASSRSTRLRVAWSGSVNASSICWGSTIARDLLSRVIRSGNRSLLREIAGPDCGRPGRLRAALAATRLSDMNARDQRFATCDGACASFEELTRRDLGAGDQLDKATSECKLELLVRRTSELLNPARVENSDDEVARAPAVCTLAPVLEEQRTA